MNSEHLCCEAAIRVIEARLGHSREGRGLWDAERTRGVEVEIHIGSTGYAIEHTQLEPYGHQLAENIVVTGILEPIEERVRRENLVPARGYFLLTASAGSLTSIQRSKFDAISSRLFEWVKAALQDWPDSLQRLIRAKSTPVPFEVVLTRHAWYTGRGLFKVARSTTSDTDDARDDRMRIALTKKLPKLAACVQRTSRPGENPWRSALVLENRDFSLSNVVVIAQSLDRCLGGADYQPSEIYLVEPYTDERWTVWTLRRDGRDWRQLQSPQGAFEFADFSRQELVSEDRI